VEQLKTDLHRAAETISELRITVAQQEEDEKQRQEAEALRVEQEESEMIASVKSEMDKQMAQLKDSLNAQIVALESELEEERKSSVHHQHDMQRRLEEATSRLSASESEMTAQLVKKEAKLTKQLQASEKAASKAVSLLDQKEEEVQQLQAVIADMRETMKKNKVAEDEAEEGECTSFFPHLKNLFKIAHSYNLPSSHVTP
jgi:chromosome segregation ATPase